MPVVLLKTKNPPEGGFFVTFICPRGEAFARKSRG